MCANASVTPADTVDSVTLISDMRGIFRRPNGTGIGICFFLVIFLCACAETAAFLLPVRHNTVTIVLTNFDFLRIWNLAVYAQKRLFINFWAKFWHLHWLQGAWFHNVLRVTFHPLDFDYIFNFFILQSHNPPYFYFRLIWPSDLENAMLPTWIISTKFELMTLSVRPTDLWRFRCYYDESPIKCHRPLIFWRWTHRTPHDQVIWQFNYLEHPMVIHSWINDGLKLTAIGIIYELRPLRMRCITWPVA